MNFFDPVKNKRIAVFSPIIAALIAGTYYIAMKIDFDADIGHFARGSVPFIICVVLSVLSGAAAVLSYYSAKKYDLDRSDFRIPDICFRSGACFHSFVCGSLLRSARHEAHRSLRHRHVHFPFRRQQAGVRLAAAVPHDSRRVHPHLSQADAEHMASHSLLHFRRALPERVPLRVLL